MLASTLPNCHHTTGAEALAALLVSPKCRLRRLDLRSCEVADTGAAALAGKLAVAASRLAGAAGQLAGPSSRGLEELDLSDNQMTAAGEEHVTMCKGGEVGAAVPAFLACVCAQQSQCLFLCTCVISQHNHGNRHHVQLVAHSSTTTV